MFTNETAKYGENSEKAIFLQEKQDLHASVSFEGCIIYSYPSTLSRILTDRYPMRRDIITNNVLNFSQFTLFILLCLLLFYFR